MPVIASDEFQGHEAGGAARAREQDRLLGGSSGLDHVSSREVDLRVQERFVHVASRYPKADGSWRTGLLEERQDALQRGAEMCLIAFVDLIERGQKFTPGLEACRKGIERAHQIECLAQMFPPFGFVHLIVLSQFCFHSCHPALSSSAIVECRMGILGTYITRF